MSSHTDKPTEDLDPVASVVVPSYRGADRLPTLLDSLAGQRDGTPPFEVVVVIDGDDDGSLAIVEAENRFRVTAIMFPENRGRVAALNAGFAAAHGEVLIRCDDDLVPSEDYVFAHVSAHKVRDPVGVVGLYCNQMGDTPYADAYGKPADVKFRQEAYSAPEDIRWRYWAGNCSITRSTWDYIGAYDPDYRLYGWEDVDYGARLHEHGIRVALLPALETAHRVAADSARVRTSRAAQSAAARQIFERKHPDTNLPPMDLDFSLWNLAVRWSSAMVGLLGAGRAGAVVDSLLPLLPRPLRSRVVALVVEGSAHWGYHHASSAAETF